MSTVYIMSTHISYWDWHLFTINIVVLWQMAEWDNATEFYTNLYWHFVYFLVLHSDQGLLWLRSASMKVRINEGPLQWRSASTKVRFNEGLLQWRSACALTKIRSTCSLKVFIVSSYIVKHFMTICNSVW
jgi:hypothetical protein